MPQNPRSPFDPFLVGNPQDPSQTGGRTSWEDMAPPKPPESKGYPTLANLVRAGSGFGAIKGGPVGALIAGTGEAGAEMLEGSTFRTPKDAPEDTLLGSIQKKLRTTSEVEGTAPTPIPVLPGISITPSLAQLKGFISGALSPIARIATAAGIGSVPIAKTILPGKALQSAVRSGALSGAGTIGREMAAGEPVTPGSIAFSTGLGALIGGGFGAASGWLDARKAAKVAEAAKPIETPAEVVTTAGDKTFGSGRFNKRSGEWEGGKVIPTGKTPGKTWAQTSGAPKIPPFAGEPVAEGTKVGPLTETVTKEKNFLDELKGGSRGKYAPEPLGVPAPPVEAAAPISATTAPAIEDLSRIPYGAALEAPSKGALTSRAKELKAIVDAERAQAAANKLVGGEKAAAERAYQTGVVAPAAKEAAAQEKASGTLDLMEVMKDPEEAALAQEEAKRLSLARSQRTLNEMAETAGPRAPAAPRTPPAAPQGPGPVPPPKAAPTPLAKALKVPTGTSRIVPGTQAPRALGVWERQGAGELSVFKNMALEKLGARGPISPETTAAINAAKNIDDLQEIMIGAGRSPVANLLEAAPQVPKVPATPDVAQFLGGSSSTGGFEGALAGGGSRPTELNNLFGLGEKAEAPEVAPTAPKPEGYAGAVSSRKVTTTAPKPVGGARATAAEAAKAAKLEEAKTFPQEIQDRLGKLSRMYADPEGAEAQAFKQSMIDQGLATQETKTSRILGAALQQTHQEGLQAVEAAKAAAGPFDPEGTVGAARLPRATPGPSPNPLPQLGDGTTVFRPGEFDIRDGVAAGSADEGWSSSDLYARRIAYSPEGRDFVIGGPEATTHSEVLTNVGRGGPESYDRHIKGYMTGAVPGAPGGSVTLDVGRVFSENRDSAQAFNDIYNMMEDLVKSGASRETLITIHGAEGNLDAYSKPLGKIFPEFFEKGGGFAPGGFNPKGTVGAAQLGKAAQDIAEGFKLPHPSVDLTEGQLSDVTQRMGKELTPPAPEIPRELPSQSNPDTSIAGAEFAAGTPNEAAASLANAPSFWARLKNLAGGERSGFLPGSETGALSNATMLRLGTATGGALAGGVIDTEHPLRGASAGAVVGAMMPAAFEALPKFLAQFANQAGRSEAVKEIVDLLPRWQRFSLLSDIEGQIDNAVVAPFGSGILASVERTLQGDPRGMVALRKLTHGMDYIREFKGHWTEAASRIGRAEGHAMDTETSELGKYMAIPGTNMTAGDLAAKSILMQSGFSEDEARKFTLTSEPELLKFIADFGKGGGHRSNPLADLLLPFKRTTANIWEQGLYRTPVLGEALQRMRPSMGFQMAPFKERMFQQGLGGLVGLGAGAASSEMDPVTAKHFRRFASNFGGMYSLPVTAGIMGGQAYAMGKPVMPAAARATIQGLPLPTTQPFTDITKMLFGDTKGNHPFPKEFIPAIMRQSEDPFDALTDDMPSPFDKFIPASQQGFDWRGPK